MTIAAIDFQLLANAGFPPAQFKPGDVVFAEGDKGDKMYVIRSGEVEILRDGHVVETLAPGGIFGEMALIDGSPRAATARARRGRWRQRRSWRARVESSGAAAAHFFADSLAASSRISLAVSVMKAFQLAGGLASAPISLRW